MKIIFLLFSLALVPLSALATCTTDTPNQLLRAVHDTDGYPLQVNTRYFVFSSCWGAGGGGVRLANIGDQEENACPTAVVQSRSDLDKGEYVSMSSKSLLCLKDATQFLIILLYYITMS